MHCCSLIHAREWISGSTCQYIAAQLVQNYHSDGQIRDLLDHNEVIMVPVVNPDGYVHAWTRDRLWRKNRRWFRFGTGVDLNRNFDDHWCETGSSRSPFTDTYCGPEGASESETQAIQNYYGRYKGQMLAAIDMHSFSQLILRPNGYSEEDCPDEARLLEASTILAKGIKSSSGKAYEPKKSAELYPTSGTATDYFYWVPGQEFRPYSITIELRPVASKSYNGFIVDPAQIIPCGEEIMSGLVPFLRYAMENPIQANKTEKIIPRGSSEEARSGQVGLSHKDPTRRLSSLSPNTSSSPADGLLGFLPVYTAHRQDTPSQPAR